MNFLMKTSSKTVETPGCEKLDISPHLFEIDGQSVRLESAFLAELEQSLSKLLTHFFQVPAIDMQSAVRALITSAVRTLHRVTETF